MKNIPVERIFKAPSIKKKSGGFHVGVSSSNPKVMGLRAFFRKWGSALMIFAVLLAPYALAQEGPEELVEANSTQEQEQEIPQNQEEPAQAAEESATEQVVEPIPPEVVSGPQAPPPPAEVPTPAFSVLEEIEPNNLEPQVVPSNSNVLGRLSDTIDQDLFEFTIGATSKVTITFRNMEPIPPTTNGIFPVGWRVSIFGDLEHQSPYNLVFGARLDRSTATRTIGLWAGTYLVRISAPFNIPITGFSKNPYTLEIRTEPLGDTRDIEPNDTTDGAILIDTDGSPYSGWFQSVDDTDYYRVNIVNITSTGDVVEEATTPFSISISTPGEPTESVYLETALCLKDATIFAADDLNTPVASFCILKGRNTGYTLYLETGLYFIRLKSKPYQAEILPYTLAIQPGQF